MLVFSLDRKNVFDDAKVETKLCALRPGDLERRDFSNPSTGCYTKLLSNV
jgi:hypothetical protein